MALSAPTPSEFLKMPIGADRQLADYRQITAYFRALEQYGFEPKSLDNKTIRAGKLSESFDAIVLPDVSKEILVSGKPRTEEGAMRYFPELPPDYACGIEKKGAKTLKDFVEAGGTLVAFSAATEWVTDEFNIPVRNTIARIRPDDFGCPGSLLWVQVTAGTPLTYGLPEKLAVFQDKPIAFDTAPPAMELQRFVLLGFRAQHRAQTPATYPFLFNALWWSTAK